jgi:hypothetical protein
VPWSEWSQLRTGRPRQVGAQNVALAEKWMLLPGWRQRHRVRKEWTISVQPCCHICGHLIFQLLEVQVCNRNLHGPRLQTIFGLRRPCLNTANSRFTDFEHDKKGSDQVQRLGEGPEERAILCARVALPVKLATASTLAPTRRTTQSTVPRLDSRDGAHKQYHPERPNFVRDKVAPACRAQRWSPEREHLSRQLLIETVRYNVNYLYSI